MGQEQAIHYGHLFSATSIYDATKKNREPGYRSPTQLSILGRIYSPVYPRVISQAKLLSSEQNFSVKKFHEILHSLEKSFKCDFQKRFRFNVLIQAGIEAAELMGYCVLGSFFLS